MDIKTPRGQISLEQERRMIQSLCNQWGLTSAETQKDGTAKVDGVFLRDGKIIAVYESKCRDMSLEKLKKDYNNEWLITTDKIDGGRLMARILRVPFIGLVYLLPDEKFLVIDIADDWGLLKPKIRRKKSLTQATINGGEVIRDNSYITITGCKVLNIYP